MRFAVALPTTVPRYVRVPPNLILALASGGVWFRGPVVPWYRAGGEAGLLRGVLAPDLVAHSRQPAVYSRSAWGEGKTCARGTEPTESSPPAAVRSAVAALRHHRGTVLAKNGPGHVDRARVEREKLPVAAAPPEAQLGDKTANADAGAAHL